MALAVLIPFLSGLFSGILTKCMSPHPDWFNGLQRPNFAPANWVYGVVWTVLWVAQGISSWIVYAWEDHSTPLYAACATFYALELFLEFLWPVVFFGAHSLRWSMGIIVVTLAVTATLCGLFFQVSPWAGWPVAVLLAWVAFATFLNLTYLLINARYEARPRRDGTQPVQLV